MATALPADAMDLHSDSGFDFGDEDIDLDLGQPSLEHNDDDVSLQDVGLDGQTATPDNDEFMVDDENLIKDDEIDYNHPVVGVAQPSGNSPRTAQQIPDDDLIDYSDDEDISTPYDNGHDAASNSHTQHMMTHTEGNFQHDAVGQDDAVDQHPKADATDGSNHDNYEEYDQVQQQSGFEHDTQLGSVTVNADSTEDWDAEPDADAQPEHDVDGHQKPNPQLSEEELYADGDEDNQDEHVDQEEPVHVDQDDAKAIHAEAEQSDELDLAGDENLNIGQVTVNWAGTELWLFKRHDLDESGDWLLEDESAAHKDFCTLFSQCRAALAEVLTPEIEIGFHFDSLHDMELYEDSTVCVVTNLEQLVGLYYELHEQDGTIVPDCFYMTLKFRPRFSAHLGHLQKAVEEGIGHEGLNELVSAGHTSFYSTYSDGPKYDLGELEPEELENEQQEPDAYPQQHDGSNDMPTAQQEVGAQDETVGDDAQEEEEEESSEPKAVPSAPAPVNDSSTHHEGIRPSDDSKETEVETTAQLHVNSPPAPGFSNEHDEDYIDYSDDEAAEEVNENRQQDDGHQSSSSSTVQGDDTAHRSLGSTQEAAPLVEDQDSVDHCYHVTDNGTFHAPASENNGTDDEFGDNEFNQEFGQGYDQIAPDTNHHAHYSNYENYGDEANYQHDDSTYFNADENTAKVDETELAHGVDHSSSIDSHGAEDATANAISVGNEAVDPTADEDYIDYDDDDGVVEQGPVVTSSVKRSFDEFGNELTEAFDSTDPKRPKL